MNHTKQPKQTGFASIEEQERVQREIDLVLAQDSPIDLAAANWHDRSVRGLSAQEAHDYAQWRAQSPAHAAAYDDVAHSYQLRQDLSLEHTAQLRPDSTDSSADAWPHKTPAQVPGQTPKRAAQHAPQHPSAIPPSAKPPGDGWALPRRHLLVAAVCSALLAVVAWPAWQAWNAPRFQASYATEQGQRQDIQLEDGSQLTLDTNTHINVRLYRNRRLVQLLDGQVLLHVAPDAKRPLEVQAGPATVQVVGTRFSVRHLAEGHGAGAVEVQVEEGTVTVQSQQAGAANNPTSTHILQARQSLQINPEGLTAAVAPLPTGDFAPWRNGLIRFNKTRLADALVELERYGPTRLAMTDPKVAALLISGVYETNRPDHFATMLTSLHPVKLVQREDGQTVIELRR